MPYEFTPEERFQHIAWVLEQLQDRFHSSDSSLRDMWSAAISTQLGFLAQAVCDMRPKTDSAGEEE